VNINAIKELVKVLAYSGTGCVAGNKGIKNLKEQKATGAGEGLYWKYESFIKQLESLTGSVTGAAGELFAVKRELYPVLDDNLILDDFAISMKITQKGYSIKYAPLARGEENASLSVKEEMKRKIRIASGCMQALVSMPELLNPFKNGLLTFKYLSHKVLRWTIVPFAFIMVFILNTLIVINCSDANCNLYILSFILQAFFYLLALSGYLLRNNIIKYKLLYIPYYICIMNLAMIIGIIRFFSGNYSVCWEKSERS